MDINNDLLEKGFKRLLVVLLLLIISPISLNIGFKALSKYPDESIWIAYVILGFGMLLTIVTIIFGIKTFKIILDALFNSK